VQVLAEAHTTLANSVAAQSSKLSTAQSEAESARDEAKAARSQVSIDATIRIQALLIRTFILHACMQHLKDASKKEKLAKELATAVLQEDLKLKQLQSAQKQLQQKGTCCCCLHAQTGLCSRLQVTCLIIHWLQGPKLVCLTYWQ